MNLHDLIISLERLKRERAALNEQESILAKPVITDLERMDDVYSAFNTIGGSRNTFIIIAVRLFSPRSLAGNNLAAGVRNKMAMVLGCEPTVVSHAFENLVFFYKKYKNFRKEVDRVYSELCGMLGIE